MGAVPRSFTNNVRVTFGGDDVEEVGETNTQGSYPYRSEHGFARSQNAWLPGSEAVRLKEDKIRGGSTGSRLSIFKTPSIPKPSRRRGEGNSVRLIFR